MGDNVPQKSSSFSTVTETASEHYDSNQQPPPAQYVTLRLGDNLYIVETRTLASSSSPYLVALVRGGWREQGASEIDILHECDTDSFEGVLRFVYGARCDSLCTCASASDVHEPLWNLMSAARYFQLEELVAACEDRITPNLTMDNLCSVWTAASELSCDRLARACRGMYEDWDRAGNLRRAAPPCGSGVALQLAFSIDTTGSMGSCIGQLKQRLAETVGTVLARVPQSSVAVISHGDYCDETVVRKMDFTDHYEDVVIFVGALQPAGGGPTPEAYEWALHVARGLAWREDACKALVVIGDSYPHAPSYTSEGTFWKDEADALAKMGVRVYGMAAAGVNPVAICFYKELSRRTGAVFIDFSEWSLITELCLATICADSERLQMESFVASIEEEEEEDGVGSKEEQESPERSRTPEARETTDPQGPSGGERVKKRIKPVVGLDKDEPDAPHTREGWWDRAFDRGKTEYRLCPARNVWVHNH